MNTRRISPLKYAALALVALLGIGASKAYAQAHDYGQPHNQRHERADFKDHLKQERRDYGSAVVREHQREENRAFKNEERQERWGGNGAYGYSPYASPYGGYSYPGGYGYPSGQVHGDGHRNYGDPYHGNDPFWGGGHSH
jgi:hypothetical protein